jgi:hypothetical protein
MDMPWEALAGSALSGALITAMAKAFLSRSLKDLDGVVSKISEIKEQLAGIAVKLETASKESELLHEHDRKIAAMEQLVYGSYRHASPASQPRQKHNS